MGILAALLRRRPVRHAQHRAASAGAGACRRLVPRAHSVGRRAAVGARGRSASRHPPTRHAPRPAAVGVDASHPRRHHRDRARTASPVAGRPRGGAAISATRTGPRRHRREAGGQFRDGRPWHGAGATGAGPRRLAHRGHAQGRGDDELADWRDAVARIVIGLDPATGIYEQFAGFHALEPLNLADYADRTVPIDVVIGREQTQRSQVVKQSDVVALIALLPEEFPGTLVETNFRHYEPRCAHGSSLSAGFHALVAARLGDPEMALRYLRETAALDLDLDPNSAGGVRIAGLGALWQSVIFGFAGLDLMGDTLGIDPKLPPQWRSLSFRVRWRGRSVAIRIAGGTVQVTQTNGEAIEMRIAGATRQLTAGAPLQVLL